jgi:tetratricopeptide (TPR) repeat protein
MRIVLAAISICLLASCASRPTADTYRSLLHDDQFADAEFVIDRDSVFRLTDDMQRYVRSDIAPQLKARGLAQGLFDALYSKNQLQLEYDAVRTKTAAEAFAARSGNCLSLVIMTAAFAKELGMFVYVQGVATAENWQRQDDLYITSGHVNITLGRKRDVIRAGHDNGDLLTIDFTPLPPGAVQRAWRIDEATVAAMYMNNRAAETLAQGRPRTAYWWAREAILLDPDYLPGYNTLAVAYRRSGYAADGERVLQHVLSRDADNVPALANRIAVLNDLGRTQEMAEVSLKLKRLMPYEPYYFFNLGEAAMREKNYRAARDFFSREIGRQPYNHEFHFALAKALAQLGEHEAALKHLSVALDTSTTPRDQGIYAAKLERLRGHKQ